MSPVSNKSTRKMSKSNSKSESLADVGLYGMGVMGQNFALNMASHGFNVSVSNRAASPTRVDAAVKKAVDEGNLPLRGYKDSQSFVKSLSKPRKIIILVPAGVAVDQTIESLSEHMEVCAANYIMVSLDCSLNQSLLCGLLNSEYNRLYF